MSTRSPAKWKITWAVIQEIPLFVCYQEQNYVFTHGSPFAMIINFQKKMVVTSGSCNLLCTLVHAVVIATSFY